MTSATATSPRQASDKTSISSVSGGHSGGGTHRAPPDILRDVPGVIHTDVGYTGGWLENPTYDDTHDGKSGHAEAA